MAATTTYGTLIKELGETTGLATVLPSVTGTTTGITLANAYALGPVHAQRFPRGSAILTTAGTAINESTFVDKYTPGTGVFTIEPDLSGTFTECVIFSFEKGIDHPDRFKEAINRAITKTKRWRFIPLTYVPDGDMLGATIADNWTASAGTGSYVALSHPEVAGTRVVQISHSSTATLTGTTIACRAAETWYFETAIRATTDGDTAALVIRDVTNSATITPTYEEGDGSTTSRAFVTQRGTFTVPGSADEDARIAFRLDVSGSGTMTAQMAPIIAYPQNAMSFPLQNRVEREDYIANFFYPTGGGSGSGPDERSYRGPITMGELTHTIDDGADHMVVTFNFTPSGPVYYEEYVAEAELSALTDTTTLPKERVLKWARAELYEYLRRKDNRWEKDAARSIRLANSYDSMAVPLKTIRGRV